MGRVERPALKGSWLGAALVFLNPIVKILLRTPLHWSLSRWFLIIAWTGQKTGRERSTPVSYVADEGGIWVTTGDRWPDYACGNPTFRVRRQGRWQPARALLITDLDLSRREHERIFGQHTWFRILAGIPNRGAHPDPAAIARAISAGRRLVRIEY